MKKHEVAFHIDTGTVVCTCGEYFRQVRTSIGLYGPDAVQQWANHLKEENNEHSGN